MTLIPEMKAEGWIEWNGGECPIKDDRTRVECIWSDGDCVMEVGINNTLTWLVSDDEVNIIAYRIIEAHGEDAEPARPTPFPRDYSDLVFSPDGWSQTIIVDGKRPEWLRDDDSVRRFGKGLAWEGNDEIPDDLLAIRVRRREPKRETVTLWRMKHNAIFVAWATLDLIDGTPDLSTLKIAEDAL